MNQAGTEWVMRRLKGWWNTDPENQRPIPRDVWLTAEQIAAFDVLGPGKTVKSVRQYIFRHKLSDHPTWCRKAPVQGSALEYNLLLFTPKEVAIRKRGKGPKEFSRPRAFAVFEGAEGGELFREIHARVVWAKAIGEDISSAELIRNRCFERFGKTLMRANNPDDRIEMPPLRAFRKIIKHIGTLNLAPKIDQRLVMATAGLFGQSKEELVSLIKHERKANGRLLGEIMSEVRGAKLTNNPDALRNRIRRIEALISKGPRAPKGADEASNAWLTTPEILANDFPGLPKKRTALETYLNFHGLTTDPLVCRKKERMGRAFEYHRSAFTESSISRREMAPQEGKVDFDGLYLWVAAEMAKRPRVQPSVLRIDYILYRHSGAGSGIAPSLAEIARTMKSVREAGEQ